MAVGPLPPPERAVGATFVFRRCFVLLTLSFSSFVAASEAVEKPVMGLSGVATPNVFLV